MSRTEKTKPGTAEITGNFYGISREDEEAKLIRIQELAKGRFTRSQEYISRLQSELRELQEVYDLDDREGQAQWINTDARLQEVMQNLAKAERAQKKPYFGRIDLVDSSEHRRETFYVGKSDLGETPETLEVIDWRAPIASVYYDHSLGNCDYKVPGSGIFTVDLQRKRTYEIEDNRLINYYDSDVVANDDLLTKYLSQSKRTILSEIIATIQDEQNKIIRKNPRHNILIQGSAGSGKTTVAMHRISYILYNYEKEFKPDGFYIVGSNKVLLNYITGVLPDLDVYGVRQMTMEELFVRLLYEDWDAKKYKVRTPDKKASGMEYKSGSDWFESLRAFADKTEWERIPRTDIRVEKNNHIIMKGSEIEKEIKAHPEWTMLRKFERLNDVLTSRVETELFGKYYSYNPEEQKKIQFHFKDYFNKFAWKTSVFELYAKFMEEQTAKYPDLAYVENEPDIYDLASLVYLYKRIKETEVIQEASHVVIDEAQDFGMMVYHALMYSMSKCTFTVMGDVSQNINFSCGLADWEELKKVMLPDRYDFFGLLKKSYRNTVEISNYATDILKHADFPIYPVEPIIRHGSEVKEAEVWEENEHIEKLVDIISQYKEKQYETIAVICKDKKEAGETYEKIKDRVMSTLFSGEETRFGSGVTVLPIEYSKGLEFDAVIIFDASAHAYPKEDNYAKLLYVAVTRALHELAVIHRGKITGLISDPIPEERQNITFEEDTYHLLPREFEEEFKSPEQLAMEQAELGNKQMEERDKYGPSRIIVNSKNEITKADSETPKKEYKPTTEADTKALGRPYLKPAAVKREDIKKVRTASESTIGRINLRPPKSSLEGHGLNNIYRYGNPIKSSSSSVGTKSGDTNAGEVQDSGAKEEFGTMPHGTSIKPIGHGRIDNSVKWINKCSDRVEITSANGTLCIIPVTDVTVRVIFYKEKPSMLAKVPAEIQPASKVNWKCRDSRETVEIILAGLTVNISRKTGAISFVSSNGKVILSENDVLPRQFHGTGNVWWNYFNWSKKELLNVRGKTDGEWEDLNGSAKYISHGKGSERAAVITSNAGYQILVPGGKRILGCTVNAYGNYLCYEDADCIDYFFRTAK